MGVKMRIADAENGYCRLIDAARAIDPEAFEGIPVQTVHFTEDQRWRQSLALAKAREMPKD